MTNPQVENGYTRIANELLEQIVKVRLPASEKDIVLFVIRKTYGYQKKEDRISLTQFEKGTGLSRVTIVKGLKNLLTRNILVKSGILAFSLNKYSDSWVVNAGLLVKSKNIFSKGGYTETGKGGYTYKRKKEIQKKYAEINSADIPLLIKSFEALNPACSRFYGNTTQRKACDGLIISYGFERVKQVIENTLTKTNGMQFFPTITTPVQLQDKWVTLESAVRRFQAEKQKLKSNVAF